VVDRGDVEGRHEDVAAAGDKSKYLPFTVELGSELLVVDLLRHILVWLTSVGSFHDGKDTLLSLIVID